jgi:hypothetical protein
VFEDGEIVCGVACPGAHLVVMEDNIHAPVQAVFSPTSGREWLD